jgi:hypothetical protein
LAFLFAKNDHARRFFAQKIHAPIYLRGIVWARFSLFLRAFLPLKDDGWCLPAAGRRKSRGICDIRIPTPSIVVAPLSRPLPGGIPELSAAATLNRAYAAPFLWQL